MRFLSAVLAFTILLSVRAGAQHAPNATLEPSELAEFSSQPSRIKELIVFALALTKLDLDYTFGSDDPARGGMDCSGTIYHLLHTQGLKDVPRDSQSQYDWTRAAGGYHEVASKSGESDEFADLRPGDLMFWSGTYNTGRAGGGVSHVMLYLGTEKKTRKRVMFGASDGRSYNGLQRFGVSVFDFKMPRPEQTADFLGYGRIPGLPRGTTTATIAAITPPVPKEEDEAPKPKSDKKSEGTGTTGTKSKSKSRASKLESESATSPSKTATSKSETQKSKSVAQADEAEPETPKAKTQTRKSKTEANEPKTESQKSKGDAEESLSKTQKSKKPTQKSKSETAKSKTETEEPQVETQKSKTQTQKPKSETSKPKSETPSVTSEPGPKTSNPKAGFQRPKDQTEEASADAQESKAQTPKPKPRTKSKKSESKTGE